MNYETLNRASETTLQRLRALHPSIEFHMDGITGRIAAIVSDMGITDPFMSECGRFTATPDYYGLSTKAALIMMEHNMLIPDGGDL